MKRTRRNDRKVPGPESPWDEIVPGLWMGGQYWTDALGELRPVVVDREFQLVVSLAPGMGFGPGPGVEHHAVELPDDLLTADQLDKVMDLALLVAAAQRADRLILVRCHSGYNRSGLVIAQALVVLGYEPSAALSMVRRRRSPWALNNEYFVQYLDMGLDLARELSALGEPA
ncbi:protein phosphatase [Streptomyces sp. NPDC051940]|uniref:protein-tyrosine phosphatase family protein n=1 Tax=Streptomyces sp. NPDC051940 TaxID=3155675 RepID=UPI003445588D